MRQPVGGLVSAFDSFLATPHVQKTGILIAPAGQHALATSADRLGPQQNSRRVDGVAVRGSVTCATRRSPVDIAGRHAVAVAHCEWTGQPGIPGTVSKSLSHQETPMSPSNSVDVPPSRWPSSASTCLATHSGTCSTRGCAAQAGRPRCCRQGQNRCVVDPAIPSWAEPRLVATCGRSGRVAIEAAVGERFGMLAESARAASGRRSRDGAKKERATS